MSGTCCSVWAARGIKGAMRSMTGYGRGTADGDGWRAVVEIRSVNHRFTDLKLRGVSLNPNVEERVSNMVRSKIERGAVTVTLRVERAGITTGVRIDEAAARRAHFTLKQLAGRLGLSEEVSLELVCAQPGVLVTIDEAAPDAAEDERLAGCVIAAAEEAVGQLVKMRETEGGTLRDDLGNRLRLLGGMVDKVSELTASAPSDAQARLKDRLERLLQSANADLDEARLAQEVAILADRLDVTEELVRLRSHLEQLNALLDGASGAVGRRLGFLVQELGRELNTVASKSQSADIARTIVDAKAELEKVREQVQNIE